MTQAEELDIWNEGRRELTVTKTDDSTETITIKKVPLRHMNKLLSAQTKDETLALLYVEGGADKGDAWLDSLTDESLMAILEKGDAVNDPLFEKWWARHQKKMGRMGIKIDDVVQEAMAGVFAAQKAKEQGDRSPSGESSDSS